MEIAKAMLKINGELPNIATRGDNPMKPLFMADSAGLGWSFFIPRLGWLEMKRLKYLSLVLGMTYMVSISIIMFPTFLFFLFGLHGLIISC